MDQILAVIWNPTESFSVCWVWPIHYYSLMWVVGLVAAYFLVKRFFKDRGISDETFEPLFLYCFLGI